MSGYRDETETLRAELDRVRAELATIKNEPREVEVIRWHDCDGNAEVWVVATTVFALIAAVVFAIAGAIAEHCDYRRIALAMLALVAMSLVTAVWLWIKAIPRTTVTR